MTTLASTLNAGPTTGLNAALTIAVIIVSVAARSALTGVAQTCRLRYAATSRPQPAPRPPRGFGGNPQRSVSEAEGRQDNRAQRGRQPLHGAQNLNGQLNQNLTPPLNPPATTPPGTPGPGREGSRPPLRPWGLRSGCAAAPPLRYGLPTNQPDQRGCGVEGSAPSAQRKRQVCATP